MTSKQLHYLFLYLSVAMCILIYADAYFIPTTDSIEQVTDSAKGTLSHRRNAGENYAVTTNKTWTIIPSGLYWELNYGEHVLVERSKLTLALKSISYKEESDDAIYTYHLDFIRAGLGKLLLPLLLAGNLILLIYFNKIDNLRGRFNLCCASFVASVALFIKYIDLLYLVSN